MSGRHDALEERSAGLAAINGRTAAINGRPALPEENARGTRSLKFPRRRLQPAPGIQSEPVWCAPFPAFGEFYPPTPASWMPTAEGNSAQTLTKRLRTGAGGVEKIRLLAAPASLISGTPGSPALSRGAEAVCISVRGQRMLFLSTSWRPAEAPRPAAEARRWSDLPGARASNTENPESQPASSHQPQRPSRKLDSPGTPLTNPQSLHVWQ